MVLPRPCRLPLLLKLVISTSFFRILPADTGATTSAYGFWSPLGGTVWVRTVWRRTGFREPCGMVSAASTAGVERPSRHKPNATERRNEWGVGKVTADPVPGAAWFNVGISNRS